MKRPTYLNQVLAQTPMGLVDVEINTATRPRIIGADDRPINPPIWERIVAMALKNGWSQRKVKDAVTAIGVSLTTWLVAHDLPAAGVVAGITTTLIGAYSVLVSYVCHHANVSAPPEFDPLQDTQAPIFNDPTLTLTNIQPMGFQSQDFQAQDAATAKAIREAKKPTKLPEFTVRHRSSKKGSRWSVTKYHDREIAMSRFETLQATKKDGWVEITGPGIP